MMRSYKLLIFVVMTILSSILYADNLYMYRIYLKDKNGTNYSIEHPEKFLSPRSIFRRSRQNLKVDSTDLPISKVYTDEIINQGAKIIAKSKWNNTIVIQLKDTTLINRYINLPFVTKTKRVCTTTDSISPRDKARKLDLNNKYVKSKNYYGNAYAQIKMHNGDSLHLAGYKGEGMQIAIIDGGFYNADAIKLFKKVRILGTYDFVNPNSDIYAENNHGMKVLSCIAIDKPYVMVGTAPNASFWLLRSECADYEYPIEEDFWASAIEFADSVGVDVVNTSLGYYEFDDKKSNYRYRDLNGHSSLMSNSASMVADKGMVMVCSAGNTGTNSWKKITSPADAENVLTVGAITRSKINTSFSAVGNSADGRVKPDIMAVGESACVVGIDGSVQTSNGTSFSSPIMCGLVTCLWQACHNLTAKQIIEDVKESADRYSFPDNIYGYGIPDVWKAYKKEKKNEK